MYAFCKTNFKAFISVRTNSIKKLFLILSSLCYFAIIKTSIFFQISLLLHSPNDEYHASLATSNCITYYYYNSTYSSNVRERKALRRLVLFQTSSAVALPKIKSNISNGSEIYCHCIFLYIVIVFLIKPNNLKLILRHPASPLKNTVPRKSREALLSSIWRRIRNRARSYFLEYIILTCANKITTL